MNYDFVVVKARGSTQSLESDEANSNGILFKIETTYPTWFLVSDTYIIESSTDVLKNNTDNYFTWITESLLIFMIIAFVSILIYYNLFFFRCQATISQL